MANPIRILIADDHAILREGLRALIATEPDLLLVAEASNGAEAARLEAECHPDVILMDLMMPVMDGTTAILEIIRRNPHARILVLTSFGEEEKIFPAIKAGASGYLLKDSAPRALLEAIRGVFQGQSFLHPAIARKLIEEMQKPAPQPASQTSESSLTRQEIKILGLVAQGLSNQEIADRLVVSERTVRTHVSNILEKLHLANRTQAALYALREGLANLEEQEK